MRKPKATEAELRSELTDLLARIQIEQLKEQLQYALASGDLQPLARTGCAFARPESGGGTASAQINTSAPAHGPGRGRI